MDSWRRGDTIWTDGSRLDNGKVGAACASRIPSGWTGRRYHLGTNKEVFGAEVYAIYRALSIMDQEQRSSHWYTVFVDSTVATEWIRSDSINPGQRFTIATIETCTRLMTRDSEVTVRWVPAHHGVFGNGKADEYAKAAAEGTEPDCAVPDEYRWDQPVPHDKSGYRGPIPLDRSVDLGPRRAATRVQTPPREGRQARPPPPAARVDSRTLPAAVGACGHRTIPQRQDSQDG